MLSRANIIIVEDDGIIAQEIAVTVEDAEGVVVGPAATVAEALILLDTVKIDAAILDGNLLDRDVTPVAMRLRTAQVPIVIYSAIGLPAELARVFPDIPVIIKPTKVGIVVRRLADLLQARVQDRP